MNEENIFKPIIETLQNHKSLSEVTQDLNTFIANGSIPISSVISSFIKYLEQNYKSAYNQETSAMKSENIVLFFRAKIWYNYTNNRS